MGEVRAEGMIFCDGCGEAFVPEPVIMWDRHIEYTSFSCPRCGVRYLVSVTDDSLRESIRQYERMATKNRIKRLPEKDQVLMQRMKRENLRREAVLRKMYGKEFI